MASAQAVTTRRYRGIPLALTGAWVSLGAMTESTILSPAQMEAVLPHRGCNLIPDEMVLAEGRRSGTATVAVPAGDPRGREVFGRDDGRGGRAWQEPVLAEIAALVGVGMIHERLAAEGKEAVYSAISRIEAHGLAAQDRPLEVRAVITRDRGAFTQFGGTIHQDGRVIFTGEFMSGSAPLSEIAGQPVRPGDGTGGGALACGFPWKTPALRFVDDVRAWDPEAGAITCGYTYPDDHPFVPGHFPDAALMMGVTQWQAVYDAGVEAATRLGLDGEVVVEGRMRREGGGDIVDVRELVFGFEHGVPVLRTTKRVAFREPVRPGDGLLVEATVRQAE